MTAAKKTAVRSIPVRRLKDLFGVVNLPPLKPIFCSGSFFVQLRGNVRLSKGVFVVILIAENGREGHGFYGLIGVEGAEFFCFGIDVPAGIGGFHLSIEYSFALGINVANHLRSK